LLVPAALSVPSAAGSVARAADRHSVERGIAFAFYDSYRCSVIVQTRTRGAKAAAGRGNTLCFRFKQRFSAATRAEARRDRRPICTLR
jgi:hypothetical protein